MKKLLPKTVHTPQGFTLVELLVVVSIIAILSVIGITVFTNTQKGARDAKRKGDIESISKALETHYNDTTCGATNTNPYCPVTGTWFSGGLIPTNPGPGGADYVYPSAVGSTYVVCANLENATGNSSNNTGTGTANGLWYCLKNQQ